MSQIRAQRADAQAHLNDLLGRVERAWAPYQFVVAPSAPRGEVHLSLWSMPDPVWLRIVLVENGLESMARLELLRGTTPEDNPSVVVTSPSLLPVDLDIAVAAVVAAARTWKEGSTD